MTDAVKKLVARFKTNPNSEFTPVEAETLATAVDRDLWAAKAAALHYFKAHDLPRALILMQKIALREPTDENIRNVAILYRDARQFSESIAWLYANERHLDAVRFHDLMCSNFAKLGDRDAAVKHGDISLRLKDERAEISPRERAWISKPFDPENRQRNVISFSVWGPNERYLRGAINNAIVARYLYPGWTARFYTDGSTPAEFRAVLQQNAADVVVVPDLPASQFGLYWRFLVEDDDNVDIYVVRDADSVMNIKERAAVADWLKSGLAFHVMRDELQHSELVLAGMWGAHRGNINNMRAKIEKFDAQLSKRANYVHKDQHFLRSVIWPIMRDNVKIHDRYFSFMNPARYDPSYELPSRIHIGQNDWVHFRKN